MSSSSSTNAATAEVQTAAYQSKPIVPTGRPSLRSRKVGIGKRVVDARNVLLELQIFVDKATQTIEIGDQLKHSRQKNVRLRRSLLRDRAANEAFQGHVDPAQIAVAALTRTVVRNWLETIRLEQRSDDADRTLTTAQQSWVALERRVTTLRSKLAERRAELHDLRVERATLSLELGRTRREITAVRNDIRELERQRQEIADTSTALRRDVTARLRAVLLEDDDR